MLGSRQYPVPTAVSSRLKLKRIVAKALRSFSNRRLIGSRRLILTYHDVGDSTWSISRRKFIEQMEYLNNNARILALHEILAAPASPGLTCAVTFDDGYVGVYENAFPVLARLGFSAAVYVVSDALGECDNRLSDYDLGLQPSQRMLSWAQIKELNRYGFPIGSHLQNHIDLSRLSANEAQRQLTGSRQTIEQHLSGPCRDLAYPFGRFSAANLQAVSAAGYQTAVTTLQRPLTADLDFLRIPRFDVRSDFELVDFRALLEGNFDFLAVVQMLRRSVELGKKPIAQVRQTHS